MLLPSVCLLHKGEPSVSRLTWLLIAITGTHSQSGDLEPRQPRSTAQLRSCTVHVVYGIFVKAKIRVHPQPPEGSETQTLRICVAARTSVQSTNATYSSQASQPAKVRSAPIRTTQYASKITKYQPDSCTR